MDPRQLRETACQVNRDLVQSGLVVLAVGDANVVDRSASVIAIKPSGSACADLEPGAYYGQPPVAVVR